MTAHFPETILYNGKITTLDQNSSQVSAIAFFDGKILATGDDKQILSLASEHTVKIDLLGKRVVPGLNDSHLHLIRGGLNYNMELRWEGVTSVADALAMLQIQAANTPAPQWGQSRWWLE